MTIKLPIEKRWSQVNQGDLLGALTMSKNIDLDDIGQLRLAQRTSYLAQEVEGSGDEFEPYAIEYFKGNYYLASEHIGKLSAPINAASLSPTFRVDLGSSVAAGYDYTKLTAKNSSPSTSDFTEDTLASGTSITKSVTIANNEDRELLVMVSFEEKTETTFENVTATFDGDAMTIISLSNTSGGGRYYVFKFEDPAVKTGDVVVTFPGTEDNINIFTLQLSGLDSGGSGSGSSTTDSIEVDVNFTSDNPQHILAYVHSATTTQTPVGSHTTLATGNTGYNTETLLLIGQSSYSFEEDFVSPGVITHDITVWNNELYFTTNSRIYDITGSTFSDADFDNTGDYDYHALSPNVTNSNLLSGDGHKIKRSSSDGTTETAIEFPEGYQVRWIRKGQSVNYIGLDSKTNSKGGIVGIWDGLDTTLGFNQIIYTNTAPLSGVVDGNGILWVIFADGTLQRFNGSGFTYQAELPVFRDFDLRGDWGGSLKMGSKVLPRGMQIINEKIHISVTTENKNKPNFQAGVWVYDLDSNAFYHKYGLSNSNTEGDYGQMSNIVSGAIYPIVYTGSAPAGSRNMDESNAFIGAMLDREDTDTLNIVTATTGFNVGQFQTARVESSQITNNNLSIWCKFSGLSGDNDKITFKYRTTEKDAILFGNNSYTWSSATTIVIDHANMANAEVGDELTVLSGNGAGVTAHITSITESSGSYTVVLDESITGVSENDTARVAIENWNKLTTEITKDDTLGYKKIDIVGASKTPWIQVKGEMRGEGRKVAIEELIIVTSKDKPFN